VRFPIDAEAVFVEDDDVAQVGAVGMVA